MTGWIAVDLDGTLAHYTEWPVDGSIGAPIPRMIERVKAWLAEGRDVRIFTARIAPPNDGEQLLKIEAWCEEHLGLKLPVTCQKDYGMIELWDDRCEQVIPNTGQTVSELLTGRLTKADPSCHACGAPIKLGEAVALFHRECDPCRLV